MVGIKGYEIKVLETPCLRKGGYSFFSGFKQINKASNKYKCVTVNSFFFVKISRDDDPCIGELKSVWKDKYRDIFLSSVRLYFLPEQTAEGREGHHGQHEVLAASDEVILRLSDLAAWITDEVDWTVGLESPRDAPPTPPFTLPFLNVMNPLRPIQPKSCSLKDKQANSEQFASTIDQQTCAPSVVVLSYPQYCRFRGMMKKAKEMDMILNSNNLNNNNINNKENKLLVSYYTRDLMNKSFRLNNLVKVGGKSENDYSQPNGKINTDNPANNGDKQEEENSPEDVEKQLNDTIGSVTKHNQASNCLLSSKPVFVLFCRETFEHEGLLHHDLNCEHLAPKLKKRPRKRTAKQSPLRDKQQQQQQQQHNDSDSSEENKIEPTRAKMVRKSKLTASANIASNSSNNNKLSEVNNESAFDDKVNCTVSGGISPRLAEKCLQNESEFIRQLYRFMKERKTPIQRIPHLGFKKINLFCLFTFTQKLGGYEKITCNREWKKVFNYHVSEGQNCGNQSGRKGVRDDELNGNPRSTSAATCTRRHFEKLLLPFEKYLNQMRGIPAQKKSKKRKKSSPPYLRGNNNNYNSNCKNNNDNSYQYQTRKKARKSKRLRSSSSSSTDTDIDETESTSSYHSNCNDDKEEKRLSKKNTIEKEEEEEEVNTCNNRNPSSITTNNNHNNDNNSNIDSLGENKDIQGNKRPTRSAKESALARLSPLSCVSSLSTKISRQSKSPSPNTHSTISNGEVHRSQLERKLLAKNDQLTSSDKVVKKEKVNHHQIESKLSSSDNKINKVDANIYTTSSSTSSGMKRKLSSSSSTSSSSHSINRQDKDAGKNDDYTNNDIRTNEKSESFVINKKGLTLSDESSSNLSSKLSKQSDNNNKHASENGKSIQSIDLQLNNCDSKLVDCKFNNDCNPLRKSLSSKVTSSSPISHPLSSLSTLIDSMDNQRSTQSSSNNNNNNTIEGDKSNIIKVENKQPTEVNLRNHHHQQHLKSHLSLITSKYPLSRPTVIHKAVSPLKPRINPSLMDSSEAIKMIIMNGNIMPKSSLKPPKAHGSWCEQKMLHTKSNPEKNNNINNDDINVKPLDLTIAKEYTSNSNYCKSKTSLLLSPSHPLRGEEEEEDKEKNESNVLDLSSKHLNFSGRSEALSRNTLTTNLKSISSNSISVNKVPKNVTGNQSLSNSNKFNSVSIDNVNYCKSMSDPNMIRMHQVSPSKSINFSMKNKAITVSSASSDFIKDNNCSSLPISTSKIEPAPDVIGFIKSNNKKSTSSPSPSSSTSSDAKRMKSSPLIRSEMFNSLPQTSTSSSTRTVGSVMPQLRHTVDEIGRAHAMAKEIKKYQKSQSNKPVNLNPMNPPISQPDLSRLMYPFHAANSVASISDYNPTLPSFIPFLSNFNHIPTSTQSNPYIYPALIANGIPIPYPMMDIMAGFSGGFDCSTMPSWTPWSK